MKETYRLVNTATIQSLHGALSSTRVIKLDEAVVVAFAVKLLGKSVLTRKQNRRKDHFFELI